jgi:hypothetical protein
MYAAFAVFFFAFGIFLSLPSQAAQLRPFHTDACTYFPNGTREHKELWKDCCIQHDLYLWAGGSRDDRMAVDQQLKECVLAKGAPVPAWVMYLGVRMGSHSPIRYKEFEWGNAWNVEGYPARERFQALSELEIGRIAKQIFNQKHPDLTAVQVREFLFNLQRR